MGAGGLDGGAGRRYCGGVIPPFNERGLLPPGVHWADWDEVRQRFGGTAWRLSLLEGLRNALDDLRQAGCRTAYIDGSFVTAKQVPNDFDACWEVDGVLALYLDPALLDFSNRRPAQKEKYRGELFIASDIATADGIPYYQYFQRDTITRELKGIVGLDLTQLA